MSADALRTELEEAAGASGTQRRKLRDVADIPLSADTSAAVSGELAAHEHRQALIQAVLTALDALEADGYPEVPRTGVAKSVLDELHEERDALDKAIAALEAAGPPPPPPPPQASTVNVDLGQPQTKA